MRWKAAASLVVLGLVGLPSLSFASSVRRPATTRITVKPTTGSPRTRFVVSFRAPERTGRIGSTERRYQITAAGPVGRACDASAFAEVAPTHRGARVRVTLGPHGIEGVWCPGTYHGTVEETVQPVCARGRLCPQVLIVRPLGGFTFHVKMPRHGDTTAPTFAGIQSAFACTPGPQRPGQTTPYTLSWKPASDDVTPSPQIVYDVFMSARAGGEDFTKPTWTTPPGTTTFRTPGLPSHGTFFFVVRARDQAGNEDHNRVERRGLDPCV